MEVLLCAALFIVIIASSIVWEDAKKKYEEAKEREQLEQREREKEWVRTHTDLEREREYKRLVSKNLKPCDYQFDEVRNALMAAGFDVEDKEVWTRLQEFIIQYGSMCLLANDGLIPFNMAYGTFEVGKLTVWKEKTIAEIYVIKSIWKILKKHGYERLKYKPVGPMVEYMVERVNEQDIEGVKPEEYCHVRALVYPPECRPCYIKS